MMSNSPAQAVDSPHTGPDRRVHERVPVNLFGRCMFENKLEIPCQAINISPGDMAAIAAHIPKVGERVIIYLDDIGRIEGNVVRLFKGGFALVIKGTHRMREKLASKITWCRENSEFGNVNSRRHSRIVPRQPMSEIRLPDGRAYQIEIIDISLSGAAVKSDVRPAIGTALTLGGMQGKVVRHFDNGLAIEFATLRSGEEIENKYS